MGFLMTLKGLFSGLGIKSLTDVVTSPNGIAGILRETNNPKSKISSKKSAASALIIAAIVMSTQPITWPSAVIMGIFTLIGGLLLWKSMGDKGKTDNNIKG